MNDPQPSGPAGPQPARHDAPEDTGDPQKPEPDQSVIAPVDLQADPARWFPGRTVLVAAVISTVVLLITVVVCLMLWFTPGMEPLQIPEVEQA